jgi:hypothetical protein
LEFLLCTLTPEVQCRLVHRNHVIWRTKITKFWRNGNDSKQPYGIRLTGGNYNLIIFSWAYFIMEGGVYSQLQWVIGVFLWGCFFIQHDSIEVVTRKLYSCKLPSLNMDDSSQDQDISLKDILMAVKSQGDDITKLRQGVSNLR